MKTGNDFNAREALSAKALDLCRDDLVRHEGYVERVYLDSEGYKTFGIGHLVTKSDIEYSWPVDTPVSKVRIDNAFEKDFNEAIYSALCIIPKLGLHPEEVQRVFINMAFNLGHKKLNKFRKMIAALEAHDYTTAADEMKDSLWYKQVKTRGVELVAMMRTAGTLHSPEDKE